MKREGNPQDWLNAAELDRRAAFILLNNDQYESCVFHCQQAVEKLLKAVLVKQTNQRPEHTHSLRALLRQVSGLEGSQLLDAIVARIDAYYIGSRYPLDAVDPGMFIRPLAESAVKDMEEVFQWFLTRMDFKSK